LKKPAECDKTLLIITNYRGNTFMIKKITCALLVVIATPVAADKSGEVQAVITDMLADNFAARLLGKNCKSARANEPAIGRAAMSLRKDLMAKGYTKKEINAGTKAVKMGDRKKNGVAVLARKGAVSGNADSYCNIAAKEMATKTYLGSILKAK
jgi:hypothetical protein